MRCRYAEHLVHPKDNECQDREQGGNQNQDDNHRRGDGLRCLLDIPFLDSHRVEPGKGTRQCTRDDRNILVDNQGKRNDTIGRRAQGAGQIGRVEKADDDVYDQCQDIRIEIPARLNRLNLVCHLLQI